MNKVIENFGNTGKENKKPVDMYCRDADPVKKLEGGLSMKELQDRFVIGTMKKVKDE